MRGGGGGGGITAEEIERAKAEGRRRLFVGATPVRGGGGSRREEAVLGAAAFRAYGDVGRVLDDRSGSVLDRRSILKVDYVPELGGGGGGGGTAAAAGPPLPPTSTPSSSSSPSSFRRARVRPRENLVDRGLCPVRIKGALNLRRSPTTGIFGTAQPTVAGIRGTLNLLGAARASPAFPAGSSGDGDVGRGSAAVVRRPSVLWINLREEPTLYVNGRSTVLRERDAPFRNIGQLRGMDPRRIHRLERRLKEDVLDEAARHGGSVVLHEEVRRDELEAGWEGVSSEDVRSPEEVFFSLSMEGYRVRYVRIPTTPERAPSTRFFDGVVAALMDQDDAGGGFGAAAAAPPSDTVVIFNCQNGISRSTVGMIAGGLVQLWRGLISVPPAPVPSPATESGAASTPPRTARSSEEKEDGQQQRVLSGAALTSVEEGLDMRTYLQAADGRSGDGGGNDDAVSRQLQAGWYRPTMALIRLLDTGLSSKRHVDFFCDDAAHLVNLRLHIFAQWIRAGRERHGPTGLLKVRRAATALLRYMLLVTFDAYLSHQVVLMRNRGPVGYGSYGGSYDGGIHDDDDGRALAGGGSFPETFHDWLEARPEIRNQLSAVEREPVEAMEAFGPRGGGVAAVDALLPADVASAVRNRRGSVLAADTILKADSFPAKTTPNAAIRGATNFRKVEGTRVYGVSTPTSDAAADIVRYIQSGRARTVVWTNLREEPVVYVNGEPFVLRSVARPFRNADDFADARADRIEAAERRLKDDVLAEARRCGGRVLVHAETDDRSLRTAWIDVAVEEDVLTPRELFESLSESGLSVDYARAPQTPERPPSVEDVERIVVRVRERASHPGSHFVLSCQMGRGRSTTAMAIALLELQRSDAAAASADDADGDSTAPLDSLRGVLSSEERRRNWEVDGSGIVGVSGYRRSDDEEEEDGDAILIGESSKRGRDEDGVPRVPSSSAFDLSNAPAGEDDDDGPSVDAAAVARAAKEPPTYGEDEFSVLLSLVRVLRHGVAAKSWADLVAARCGEVENVRGRIVECIERANTSRTVERGAEHVERALLNLRRFFVLVLVAAYEIDYDAADPEPFGAWYRRHREIATIYEGIRGRDALRYASVDRVLSGPPPTEQNELAAAEAATEDDRRDVDAPGTSAARFVAGRNGSVLTRGSIVKSDHFPGCNRLKDAAVKIDGVPNFREIRSRVEVEDDVGIYGTGIPTVAGLRRVLDRVSKRRRGNRRIVWINLREEPILYVNGKPYVLRKLEHPFENLEHTGISRERVESMEDRLKLDVLNEVLADGGRLLVHDEDESGIKPTWVTVDISEGSTSIQTPRDLYKMLADEYDVTQYRVPITDEQAPKITDYDEISNIVRVVPLDAQIVVNCQMGRGRTTTGLVIATAVRLWEHSELRDFSARFEQLAIAGNVKTRRKIRGDGLDAVTEKYLGGGYDAIASLTRVLDQGNGAKATIDAVVDACDSMQNLREAIFTMKEASESEDKSRVQRVAALNRGVHYLCRYYQLIAFAAYLFCYSPEDRARLKTFAAWLKERRELTSQMKRITLD